MLFLVFRWDHLRSTSGIICGSGSFAVQFGDHFRSGDHLRSGIICDAVHSEFYYPGELPHSELFQSPTHSESKERNLTLLANGEARNFPELSQKPTSKLTVKETTFSDNSLFE